MVLAFEINRKKPNKYLGCLRLAVDTLKDT